MIQRVKQRRRNRTTCNAQGWEGAPDQQRWLRSRGRSRLKRLKIDTGLEEPNYRASVRHIHRHRNALKPLPDKSSLCQIVADRAIRVIAVRRVRGCHRRRVLGGKSTAFANAPAQMPGMVNAKEVVQSAPKERRYA